jgi:hypothetical protein
VRLCHPSTLAASFGDLTAVCTGRMCNSSPARASWLKEEFGGDHVMVRGAKKVGIHLMFGLIVLFADQLLKLVS